MPQRVEAISALFLGVPYKLGPLGEGPDGEFDRDPLIRFDAFDCTTFVETVMALALDSDLDFAARTLQKIRYKDGQIGYATRNHFIELDWVPNNVRAGYLHDITSDVAGRNAVKVHKTISKRRWYRRKSLASLEGAFTKYEKQRLLFKLRHLGSRLPDERATLTVLPLKALPPRLRTSIPARSPTSSMQIGVTRGHSSRIRSSSSRRAMAGTCGTQPWAKPSRTTRSTFLAVIET